MDLQNYIASGGVSGAIIAVLYIGYKCCYRRKFHSKCCGGEVDVGSGEPSPPKDKQATFEIPPAPRASPALPPQSTNIEIPPLKLDT